MTEENREFEVTRRKTKIEVPHLNGKLTFIHPAYGPESYPSVMYHIQAARLTTPTSAQTASLIKGACDTQCPEAREIKTKIANHWFWEFTVNLYLPEDEYKLNDGILLVDRLECGETYNPDGTRVICSFNLDRKTLEKTLETDSFEDEHGILWSQDKTIRFVPFKRMIKDPQKAQGEIGELTPHELAKNPYIIARYGEEGAEKIAGAASTFRHPPRVAIHDYWSSGFGKTSPMFSCCVLGGFFLDNMGSPSPGRGRLYVGDMEGMTTTACRGGYAFGIREPTQRKK